MLIINEAFNLFVGDDGPNNSKHLNIQGLQLPTLEEKTADHLPGGAIGEIGIGGLGLSKLECTFKLAGYDPQVMSQFGLGSRQGLPYTFYGAMRDKQGGRVIEVKSVMQGRLVRLATDELRRGDPTGHDHSITEILRYTLWFDGKEKYFYDFFTTDWRVDGVTQNADVRNILRIGGGN